MSRILFNLLMVVTFMACAIIAQATVPTASLAESAKGITLAPQVDQPQEDISFVEGLKDLIITYNSGKQLYEGILASLEAQARYVREDEIPCVLIETNQVSEKLWKEVAALTKDKGIVSMELVYWPDDAGKEKKGFYFTFIGFDDKIYY